jgi:hypothetical protein
MDGTFLTALVSGAVALGMVALTHYYGRRRDHEADWRKMKLEHYKEYVAAFFEATRPGSNMTARQRYEAAANNLNLVASSKVLIAHYDFQEEVERENQTHEFLKVDSLLNTLMRVMREDCHPKPLRDPKGFIYRRLNIPTNIEVGYKEKILSPKK